MSDDITDRLRRLSGSVSAAEERLETAEGRLGEVEESRRELTGRVDGLADRAANRDELVELLARLEDVEATTGELGASMVKTRETLGRVQTSLQAVLASAGSSAGAAGGAGAEEESGPAFESWLDCDEARAPVYIAEVIDWVKTVAVTLHPRLQITARCWMGHPVVVQALHDARTAWHQVYRSGEGSLHDLSSWYKVWTDLNELIEKDLRSCHGIDPKTGELRHRLTLAQINDDDNGWNIEQQNLLELEQAAQTFAARTMGRPARPVPAPSNDEEEDIDDGQDDEA